MAWLRGHDAYEDAFRHVAPKRLVAELDNR
jgi:hypothetical protein